MTLIKAIGVIDTPANRKQILKFEEQGSTVLKFPELVIHGNGTAESVLKIARSISDFDWIFFADIHAADVFLKILRESGADLFKLDELVVCALGESVVDRLRFVQVHSDVIPPNKDEAIVLETIENYVSGEEEFRTSKMLFIKGEETEYPFFEKLRRKVKELVEVNVYSRRRIAAGERIRLMTLLGGGAIDQFMFFSAEDVESLLHIICPERLSRILRETEVVAMTPIVFQSLRENGLKPRLAKPM